jgi:hypothetical protein
VCDDTYAEVDKTRNRNHQAKGSAAEGQVLQYIPVIIFTHYNGVNSFFE